MTHRHIFSSRPAKALLQTLASLRWRGAVLGCLVILLSCVQGAKAPKVAPSRTLDLGVEGEGGGTKKPFAVVFGGPRGRVFEPSEVSIVWNRPMRPLELAGDESAPPATITKKGGEAPKGAWRWMGTSALIFAPEKALPRATEYVVTVPAGTKALDGSVLGDAYSWSFTTPAPKLLSIDPGSGSDHLAASQSFALRFNQPVDPKEVERAGKLVVGAGKAERSVTFHATRVKEELRTLVKMTPSAPLPLDSAVEVRIDETLHGLEGPLPLGEATTNSMRTYGPLVVHGTHCYKGTPHGKCSAGSVEGVLSNAVTYKELAAHVRLEPGVRLAWGTNEASTTSEFSIPAQLEPAKSYQLVITAGLKDIYGQTLATTATLPFETDDEWPSMQMGIEGSIFEAGRPGDTAPSRTVRPRLLPIAAVNVPAYDLLTVPLDEAALTTYVQRDHYRRTDEFDEAARMPKAKVRAIRPQARTNARAVHAVALDAVLADQKGRGAAIVAYRAPAARNGGVLSDARVVLVTDLAISAKMSRFGSVVWVTRLSDGKPVPGATVAVRASGGNEVFSARADDAGLLVIAPDRYSPVSSEGQIDRGAVLFARDGDDWAYRRVDESLGDWRYSVYSDTSGLLHPIGMLFTERGVYKPGETVRLKGLFRQPLPKGTATPSGRAVHIEAYDGSGEKLFTDDAKLDSYGGFNVDVPIAASAHLGTAEVHAELPADGSALSGGATTTMMLAAYKPAEFKVEVEPSKTSFVRGDKAAFKIRGDYLYGAPMSGGTVRYTVTRGPGYFVPPGGEGLVLEDRDYWRDRADGSMRAGLIKSGDGALAADGTLGADVPLPMPEQRGAEVVTLEAEVEDLTRQTIAGRASTVVHPGEFYVAMKPPADFFVTKGTTVHPEISALEPSGKRRVGVRIHLEAVKRTWQTVLEATGESSGHYDSKPVDKTIAACDVTSAAAPVSCDLAVGDAGYVIVRASAKDARGNPLAASTGLYSLGDAADVGWLVGDGTKLDLVTDKKSYEVGQTAKILVKSPFAEAEALITVERSGIYRQERRTLTGSTPTITIPITDDLRPNAYVSVELVHGRTQAARARGDVGAPSYRLGYAALSVNPEARRLKVDVLSTKKEYRPGEQVDADITVTDRAGKPARADVTFYAVDEGVLMLTGYKTPDPIAVFSAPRALATFALESREDLVKILFAATNGAGSDKGEDGGGGGGASSVRQDFRATAFFEPSVLTDVAGKAHVHFKLPDSLTTYRLMAVVAAEDDRFGFGESQIVSSRTLMARPSMPRFLRAGDSVEAGVVVSSKGLPATSVDVTVSATGATVTGDAKRTVALPANGGVEVRWAMATPASGRAAFTFKVRASSPGQTAEDEVKVTRDVLVPLSPEAVALYGDTTDASAERLGDLGAIRSDTGGLDVRLASTALIGLDEGVNALVEYPYGCTEQLTSRLVPLIPLRDLARDYHVTLPKDLDAVIDDAVAKILKNQQPDGGFGYWVDSPKSYPWLTSYALWGLNLANLHGHKVPDEALDHATKYLRGALVHWDESPYARAEGAFIVDVLAMVGAPDVGYTDRLYEQREKMPLFARALLAHAMVVSHMEGKEAKELLRDVENHLRVTPTGATVSENAGDEYAVLMDSDARTTAIVLRALIATDKESPLAARLAKGLLAMRKGGAWRSTQENAWALLALDDYRKAQEKDAPDFDASVFLNEKELFSAPFHERSVKTASESFAAKTLFDTHAGGSTLAFQVHGSGKLFYEARLKYSRKEMPKDPLDRGFFVRKLVRSVRPEALQEALGTIPKTSATRASGSDLVLIDLLVVTPDPREQVVIDDPLPAGFEAVQAGFQTTARSLSVTEPGGEGDQADSSQSYDEDGDVRANDLAFNTTFYHREMRDDRVLTFVEHMPAGMVHYRYLARATTFGTYVVPPTRAECMYEPEIFGRTAASVFEVTRAATPDGSK